MKFKHGLPVAVACVAVGASAASQSIFAALVLLIGKGFGFGTAWSGLLFVAYYMFGLAACLFAGRLVDVFGRHHSISVGLALFAAAAVLLSFANWFPLAAAGVAALGAAAAFVLIAGMGVFCSLPGGGFPGCVPVAAAAMACGATLGAGYCALMLLCGHGWQEIYFFLGAAVLALSLFSGAVHFPQLAPDRDWQAEFRSALRLRRLYPAYIALAFYAGVEISATGWMSGYMVKALGYTPAIAAIALTLLWACVCVGRMLCSRLAGAMNAAGLFMILTAVLVVSLCLCAAVPDGRLFWIAVFGAGLGLSGLWQLLAGSALAGNAGTPTFAVMMLWECIGAAVIPFAAGVLGSCFGMGCVLGCAVALAVLCAGFAPRVLSKRLRAKPAAAPRELAVEVPLVQPVPVKWELFDQEAVEDEELGNTEGVGYLEGVDAGAEEEDAYLDTDYPEGLVSVDDAEYEGEVEYVEGPEYEGEAEYAEEPAYEEELEYSEEPGYESEPEYEEDPGYEDGTEYTEGTADAGGEGYPEEAVPEDGEAEKTADAAQES